MDRTVHPIPVDVLADLGVAYEFLSNDENQWSDAGMTREAIEGAKLPIRQAMESEKGSQLQLAIMRQCAVISEHIVKPLFDGWLEEHPEIDQLMDPKQCTFMVNELLSLAVGLFFAETAAAIQEGQSGEEASLRAMAVTKGTAMECQSDGFMDALYEDISAYISKMTPEESREWMMRYATFQKKVTNANSGS